MANSTMLSMEQVNKLAEYREMDDLRAETVQILTSQLGAITTTLDTPSRDLISSFTHVSNATENDK